MTWTIKSANKWAKENIDKNARIYSEVYTNPGYVKRRGFDHYIIRKHTKYIAVITNGDEDGIVKYIGSEFKLRNLMKRLSTGCYL